MTKKSITITTILLATILSICLCCLYSCQLTDQNIDSEADNGLYGLNNHDIDFDFSQPEQLKNLPSSGVDPSYIKNGKLHCPITAGKHEGLGRSFEFNKHGNEPNEAEITFDIWLDKNFQKDGKHDECSKFPGFEGIYDSSAGWGLKRVTTQRSWSVRIGHTGEDKNGNIPLALYVYHPHMPNTYGTTEMLNHNISKEQTHKFKLYLKLNGIGKENGIMRFYVDGKEIYHSDTWLFRLDPTVHIKAVWLDAYIGGQTPAKFNTFILLDNLSIRW